MLIIGDLATKHYYPRHKVKVGEIIVNSQDDRGAAIKKFKLDSEYTLRLSNRYRSVHTYRKNLAFEVKIYNAFNYKNAVLKMICNLHLATAKNVRIASPLYNYIFDSSRLCHVHDDYEIWFNRLLSFKNLQKDYVFPLLSRKIHNNNEIVKLTKFLENEFVLQDESLDNTAPFLIDHNYGERKELLELIKLHNNSTLLSICMDKEKIGLFSEELFLKLPYPDKLYCIMELLYIATLEAFVIPVISLLNCWPTPKELMKGFDECLMRVMADPETKFLSPYILNNIDKIFHKYSVGFYVSFKNKMKNFNNY